MAKVPVLTVVFAKLGKDGCQRKRKSARILNLRGIIRRRNTIFQVK